MREALRKILLFFLPAFFLIGSAPAHAWRLYTGWDVGATALMLKSSGFFGEGAPDTMTYSGAGAFTIACDPSKVGRLGRIHLGLQLRANMGSAAGASYSIYAPHIIARLVFKRIYFTVGGSPYAYQSGASGMSRATGKLLALAEIGYESPITPEISFQFSTGAQIGFGSGGTSPMPVVDALVGLRFYMFGPSRFIEDRKGWDGEYEGYRYPYGYPRE